MAPGAGLEPATYRLEVRRSDPAELTRKTLAPVPGFEPGSED